MANIISNSNTLEMYYRLIESLDDLSKRKLIDRLIESLEAPSNKPELKTLFGAWNDERDSDEIINQIKKYRIEKTDSLF